MSAFSCDKRHYSRPWSRDGRRVVVNADAEPEPMDCGMDAVEVAVLELLDRIIALESKVASLEAGR